MAENTQTTTTFANDTVTEWMARTMLERAEHIQVFERYAMKVTLPGGQGDTVQFVQYNRPTSPNTPLTEGVTPGGQTITVSKVTAAVDQWGGYATLSDTAILQTFHGPFAETSKLMGEQWGQIRDREAQRVLDRGTAIFYQGTATTRATLGTGSYPVTNDCLRVVESLRGKGAPEYSSGGYVCICGTASEADLLLDPTFTQASTGGGDAAPLQRGEFKRWMGTTFVRSNMIPSLVLNTACNPTTTTAASPSGDTALADATYVVVLAAVDKYGNEFAISDGTDSTATTSQVNSVVVPALITHAVGYNLYMGTTAANATLQRRGVTAGTYRVSGDGLGTNGIAYTTTGQLVQEIPAAGVTVHKMYFIAKDAFAMTDNGSMVPTLTAATTESRTTDSDPLGQRRKVGYKGWFKAHILQQSRLARLECASRFTGYQTGTI